MGIPQKIYLQLKGEIDEIYTKNIKIDFEHLQNYLDKNFLTIIKIKIIQIYENENQSQSVGFEKSLTEPYDYLNYTFNPEFFKNIELNREIIFYSLFLQRTTNLLEKLLNFLHQGEKSDSDSEILNTFEIQILDIILDYGLLLENNPNRTIENHFRNVSIETKVIRTLIVFHNEDKIIFKKLLTDLIPKYLNFAPKSHLLKQIFETVNKNNGLEIICALEKHFFPIKTNLTEISNKFCILYENSFWELLVENLNGPDQKRALFLLKRAIFCIFDQNLVQSQALSQIELIKPKTATETVTLTADFFKNYETAWKNFFIMLDTSKEKQIHLILPILGLYDSILSIGEPWKVALLKQFLFHPQNAIVRKTVEKILARNWVCPLNLLVTALNNTFLYENFDIRELLEQYFESSRFNEQNLIRFVSELDKIENFQSVPMFFIFKNLLKQKNLFETFKSDLFLKFIEIVSKNKIRYIENFLFLKIIDFCFRQNFDRTKLYFKELQKILDHPSFKYLPKGIRIHFYNPLRESLEIHFISGDSQSTQIIGPDFDNNSPQDAKTKLEKLKMAFEINSKSKIFNSESQEIYYKFLECNAKFFNENNFEEFVDLLVLDPKFVERIFRKFVNENQIFVAVTFFEKFLRNEEFLGYFWENQEIFYEIIKKIDFECLMKDLGEGSVPFSNLREKSKLEFSPLRIFLLSRDRTLLEPKIYYQNLNDFFDTHGLDYLLFLNFLLENFLASDCNFECVSDEGLILLLTKIQNELFYRGVSSFIKFRYEPLLKYQFLKMDYFQSILDNFYSKIYETSHIFTDFSILKFVFLKSLFQAFLIDKNVISNWRSVIISSLLNCPLFTRDQRIEFEVCTEIEKKLEAGENLEISENISVADSKVRLLAILLTLKIAENFDYESGLKLIVQDLVEKYKSISGKRYYENSQNHFTKLRILQILNLIFDYISDLSHLKLISDWLFNDLVSESHQTNIKILIQWLYSKIILKINENKVNLCNDLLERAKKLPGNSIVILFPILYNVIQQYELKSYEVIKFLATFSMGPNFKVRYGAQVAIRYIYEKIPNENYKIIYETAKSAIAETASENVQDKFDLAFLDLDETSKFDNIYFHLPRLSGVERNQYLFENIEILKQIGIDMGKFRSESNTVDQTNEKNLERKVLQQKLPTKDDFLGSIDQISLIDPILEKITTFSDPLKSIEGKKLDRKLTDLTERSFEVLNLDIVQKKYENTFENPQIDSNLILVATLIDKIPNLGGLSRTCEIFGVKTLVLNNVAVLKNKEFLNLSMSSENWVTTKEVKLDNLPEFLKEMKKKGYEIVGAEQTSESKNLNDFKFRKDTVLVLGNEKEGIPPNLIHLLDVCLEIPQYGQLRSLNVHVAGALFIWEYTKQISRKNIVI